ncbi:alpha/beta hydrolase [Thalassospira sp.]|uniref:alpha/beta hydrolase n=1 Tax=Thalassospira sp. TaxID=1912094 RepID=UPI0027344FA1|nr:alpha/beta hydrolase [Thalassospira sp.]MDP2700138.1 alpha/beta hydrolase [Thalassospira sp.]
MPEVIFNGPEGRLEGRYHHNPADDSPVALILHPNPQQGGTMNNKLCFNLFNLFKERGYSVMRFNFRGVGRSQGIYDHGIGELSDAASALDWMQTYNANARETWVAGYSFGAWIGMQLLMRRPEIDGFVSIAAPASEYDFTFLAPCPSSGILVHGTRDENIPANSVSKLSDKLNAQKGIDVDLCLIEGADHYFAKQQEDVIRHTRAYLDKRKA